MPSRRKSFSVQANKKRDKDFQIAEPQCIGAPSHHLASGAVNAEYQICLGIVQTIAETKPNPSYTMIIDDSSVAEHKAHLSIAVSDVETSSLTFTMHAYHGRYSIPILNFTASTEMGEILPPREYYKDKDRYWNVNTQRLTKAIIDYDVVFGAIRGNYNQHLGYLGKDFGYCSSRDLFESRYPLSELLGRSKFPLENLNFESMKTIESRQVYPNGYEYLPFLDRRLFSITSTLIAAKHELSQIERSVRYYFERKKAFGIDNPFLIYCHEENAYVYFNNQLIWMKNLQNVDNIDGNPILIFNEETVWYPLMNRDDTCRNPILKSVVGRYSINIATPHLTDTESKLVDTLRVVTRLLRPEERQIALALSLKVVARLDFINRFPSLTPGAQCSELLPWQTI